HITLGANGSATYSAASGLSTTVLAFAKQQVNTASTAKTVTMTNRGTLPSTITSITATGDFTQTNTCGTGLAVGASCTITVVFQPSASGSRTGNVTIVDNDAASPRTVALSGIGMSVTLAPTTLDFGAVKISQTSSKTVTMTNADTTGTATLGIIGISVSGKNATDYKQTNTCGTALVPGGSCTITVTFTPTANGGRNATLTVDHDAAGAPRTVTLTGTGSKK
ncbi:MAG: choice-of-anchor D domain-containing protein, partial [Actinobacteria bacterium]|nr:choice-of-anchor D domain-containing protein [Actinomycetota bacterium]